MLSLNEALAEIARRSFYEDAVVVPVVRVDALTDPVGYVVEDDPGTLNTDEWTWTYAGGVAHADSVSEISRLHDAAESYATADHIRHNLPESVAALESGKRVTFGYAAVEDGDVDRDIDGNAVDPDTRELVDSLAGWILTALIFEEN